MPLTRVDIRNAVLLSVATIAAGLITPILPYLGMPLAAFALGWMAYRFGTVPASLVALVASVPVVVLAPVLGVSPVDAAFVAVTLLAVGPLTAWALRRYSAYTVVGGVALLVTGAFLIAPIGAQTLRDSIVVWRGMLNALAASGSVTDPASVKATAAATLATLTVGYPATTAYTMAIGALASIALVSRAGRSLDQQVSRFPALADVDLNFHVVWPAIAGLVLLAVGTTWFHGTGVIYAIGYNTLMIVRVALLLQGFAVVASLYRRIGAGRLWRTIGFVLLALTELLVPSVSVLGLVDLFFNVRKLPRRQGAVSGPVL